MTEDPSQHKKLIIALIVLLSAIVLLSSVAYAINDNGKQNKTTKVDKIKKPEPLKKIKTKYSKHEPLGIWKNKTIFVIKGAKSGIKIGHYNRFKGIKYFENRCPYCAKRGHKSWNTLVYNKKRVHEGEITCSRCDSDYDCYTGYEKSGNKKYKLKLVKWKI